MPSYSLRFLQWESLFNTAGCKRRWKDCEETGHVSRSPWKWAVPLHRGPEIAEARQEVAFHCRRTRLASAQPLHTFPAVACSASWASASVYTPSSNCPNKYVSQLQKSQTAQFGRMASSATCRLFSTQILSMKVSCSAQLAELSRSTL